jgi:tetraacyldisaccharide 4'-kinase
VVASLVKGGLSCLTPLYRTAVWYCNRQFDSGSRPIESVDVPVISIGNLTTGGTGKTPMVVWVCRLLRTHHIRVAIISRGYGAEKENGNISLNDEAIELEHRLPDVPHLQDADRVKIARVAVEELEPEALVIDDGFQHRRLHRDLDIVLIDATTPFGYGRLLPRGLLREPIAALKRADRIVITRCELADEKKIHEIKTQIDKVAIETPVSLARTVASDLIQQDGKSLSIDDLKTKKWFAFSAIGNPDAFESSLESLGCEVAGTMRFPDHHRYDRGDLTAIAATAKQSGADSLICTHKDLVKVATNRIDGLNVFALQICVEIFEGREELEAAILERFSVSRS